MTHDRRGGVTLIVAFSASMVLGFAAAAIDYGSVFLQSRKLQGVADLAALAAARDIGSASAAAQATADLSNWSGGAATTTTLGSYTNDASVPVGQRFVAGGAAGNAAQVKVTAQASLYFASAILGKSSIPISRTATAATAQLASFSLGSGLASVQGGVANSLLSSLTGSSVSLSAMDYNALASANVDLFSYMNALQTRANLTGTTYDQVLNANVPSATALQAESDALTSTGQTAAATALNKVAVSAGTAPSLQMGNAINLGPYQDQDHVAGASDTSVPMNALQLANATLLAANGGRQLQLQLAGSVPGLTNITAWLAIGQRPANSPWLGIKQNGESDVIRTAQTRLYIQVQVTGVLGLLGSQPITLPVYVEAASAQAKLTSLNCPADPTSQGATMAVSPSLGQVAIASLDQTKLNDFTTPMTLTPANIVNVNLGLLSAKVTGYSDVQLGGAAWQTVNFSRAEIDAGTVKTVTTSDIASTSLATLIGNLNLGVSVAGLGLGAPMVQAPVTAALNTLGAPLDTLVNSMTSLLGVRLGEADVRTNGLRCRDAALVA